jgi:hypothetical protein
VDAKNSPQQLLGFARKLRFHKSAVHQSEPAFPSHRPDSEWHMPHAQPGMAALLNIGSRSTEAIDQKVSEPLFGSR